MAAPWLTFHQSPPRPSHERTIGRPRPNVLPTRLLFVFFFEPLWSLSLHSPPSCSHPAPSLWLPLSSLLSFAPWLFPRRGLAIIVYRALLARRASRVLPMNRETTTYRGSRELSRPRDPTVTTLFPNPLICCSSIQPTGCPSALGSFVYCV